MKMPDVGSLIARLFPVEKREHAEAALSVGGHDYNLFVDSTHTFSLSPSAQLIASITFRKDDDTMAAAKGKVTLKPVNPADNVTSRPIEVSLNGNAPMMFDLINPDQEFDCNEGDSYTVTCKGDVNAAGQGPAGNPSSGTVTIGGPTPGVPAIQEIESVTFRAA